jgi:hypothetical protein
MNTKRKVIEYLDTHPQATTSDLRKAFPGANKKSLWNYSGQWKKENGVTKAGTFASVRKRVFEYFDSNPQASMGDLKRAFPEANQISISNYRYQWKKQRVGTSKKTSIKDQVYTYINSNPDVTFGELRDALKHIKPSSISAYHSQYKHNQRANRDILRLKTNRVTRSLPDQTPTASHSGNGQDLVRALTATIEAQKITIEAMKIQNLLLKEKQTAEIDELEGLDETQLEEIKRIMGTYIKGMRRL